MVYWYVIIAVILICIELLIFYFKKTSQLQYDKAKKLNYFLGLLETLSSLPASNLKTLSEHLTYFGKHFCHNPAFPIIKVILPPSTKTSTHQVYQYQSDRLIFHKRTLDTIETSLISKVSQPISTTKLETQVLDEKPVDGKNKPLTAIVGTLFYQDHRYGYVIFYTHLNISNKSLLIKDYLSSTTNILSFILRKIELNNSVPKQDQLTALRAIW